MVKEGHTSLHIVILIQQPNKLDPLGASFRFKLGGYVIISRIRGSRGRGEEGFQILKRMAPGGGERLSSSLNKRKRKT